MKFKESPSLTVSVAVLLYQYSSELVGRGLPQEVHLPLVCTPGQLSSINVAFDGTFVAVVPI